MQYTAGQAAEAVGKNVATITRAIKSGKISAIKDASGAWKIAPAELHRVFPPVAQDLRNPLLQGNASPVQGLQTPIADSALREELAALRERIRAQDEILAERADTIADLRGRLDREGEERRKLAAILTDQTRAPMPGQAPALAPAPPPAPAPPLAPAARRAWWRRLLG